MGMGVDKARHDDALMRIDMPAGLDAGRGAPSQPGDHPVFDCDVAATNDLRLACHRHYERINYRSASGQCLSFLVSSLTDFDVDLAVLDFCLIGRDVKR